MELKSPFFRPRMLGKNVQQWLFVPVWLLVIPLLIYLLSGLGNTSTSSLQRLLFLVVAVFFYGIAIASQKERAFTSIFLAAVIFFDLLVVFGILAVFLLFAGHAGGGGHECGGVKVQMQGCSGVDLMSNMGSDSSGFFMVSIVAAGSTATPFVALIGGLTQLPLVIKGWQGGNEKDISSR